MIMIRCKKKKYNINFTQPVRLLAISVEWRERALQGVRKTRILRCRLHKSSVRVTPPRWWPRERGRIIIIMIMHAGWTRPIIVGCGRLSPLLVFFFSLSAGAFGCTTTTCHRRDRPVVAVGTIVRCVARVRHTAQTHILILRDTVITDRQETPRESYSFFRARRALSRSTMKRKEDGADLDHHLNMMLEAIERLERNRCPSGGGGRWWRANARPQLMPMQAELRTLELWRSVMAECLATFLYVAVVCGAATSDASPVLGAAAASGFTMLALTVCLQNVSGKSSSRFVKYMPCRKYRYLQITTKHNIFRQNVPSLGF